jgi:regulator of CtrA degradation
MIETGLIVTVLNVQQVFSKSGVIMTSPSQSSAAPASVTVILGDRLLGSEAFDTIFRQGMSLVDRTASYLDGEGRKDAKALPSPLSVVYATESMRLTTRLLELASWLLIRRGLRTGEMSAAEADRKRSRIKLRPLGRPSHVKQFDELPATLRSLIEESFDLNDRVMRIDQAIEGSRAAPDATSANPVAAQMAQLHSAFGAAFAK